MQMAEGFSTHALLCFIYLVAGYYCQGNDTLTIATTVSQEQIDACKPIHSAWNELAKMWTFPIINALGLRSPARFNELKRRIEGISATSLAERLTYLQSSGVVGRKVYPETPPRVEYSLTNKGWELHEILGSLADWVRRWEGKTPVLEATASSS